MLLSVAIPGEQPVGLCRGFDTLRTEHALVPPAVGFGLFDTPSHLLPREGSVDVEILGALDGRRYTVRRALDVPEHWIVMDGETGWLAAAGLVDTPRWLRENLAIAHELPLPRLFREVVCFSLPVTVAALLEEPGLRDRALANLLRTERYPTGVRWTDGVLARSRSEMQALESAVRLMEGRDAVFADVQQRLEQARQASRTVNERLTQLRLELGRAEEEWERMQGLEVELSELQGQLQSLRVTLATLEAQAEQWRQWQTILQRAQRSMQEHLEDWQGYEEASREVAKISPQLVGLDALRTELHRATAEVLALKREQALVQEGLHTVLSAEHAAAELNERVQQQQQLEQQLTAAQQRGLRLEVGKRSLQQILADTKRIEVLLADVERQLTELDQLGPEGVRLKKLQSALEDHQRQVRDATKQVDQLRFLEAAMRAVGGHLDELRKGVSITERLAVQAGGGANGAAKGADERTLSGHLRQAIDHQVQGLERQLREWQTQSRELEEVPHRLNQLRATVHQMEQEAAAGRQIEIKLGAAPALKQQRKYLRERLDALNKMLDAQLREQKANGDAPAQLSQLRQELGALNDPRAERQALLRPAARKKDIETDLVHIQRRLTEAEEHRARLEEKVQGLERARETLTAQELRREEASAGYCSYLAQQAIAELASTSQAELDNVPKDLAAQRRLREQAEARETGLRSSIGELADAPPRVTALGAQIEQAELRAAEWREALQAATVEYAAAEANRAEMEARHAELKIHQRACDLLQMARSTIQEADARIGRTVRTELAAAASGYLRHLLAEPDLAMSWKWAEAPVLVRTDAVLPLDELSSLMQAYCALALRLALADDACRFGTVLVTGLGPLQPSHDLADRLERLPQLDQFLVASGW